MSNFTLLTLVNDKDRKKQQSNAITIDFVGVRIGASLLPITEATGHFDFGNKKLTNVATATNNNEAATKGQMDTADNLRILATEKGAANGVAPLNASSKINSTYLPALAITEVFVVADIAARDALTIGAEDNEVQEGDVVVVLDGDGNGNRLSFIYDGTQYQSLNDGTVTSINGQSGAVVLDTDDITEGATNLYFTEARAKAAAVADAIVNGVTDVAPSQNAVFDALALKANDADVVKTVNGVSPTAGAVTIDTDDVDEGATNLYYTAARFNAAFAGKSTTDLAEGSNLYYTQGRFDTAFAAKLFSELANFAETLQNDNAGAITVGQVVYQKSNGNVDLARADVAGLIDADLGLVLDASIASAASGKILMRKGNDLIAGFSGLTPNAKYYVSKSVAGGIQADLTGFAAGDHVYSVGRAKSATELRWAPQYEFEF